MSTLPGSATTAAPLTSANLARWAAEQYRLDATDPPLRGAVFAIEQLELHARTLAANHEVGRRRRGDPLLDRLADSESVIGRCRELMSGAYAADRRLTPAAEWLLDNHYLIEEQIYLARKHLPRSYSRQLPRLASAEVAGLPRVYDLVRELITHVDGRVDDEALGRYLAAYQSVERLTLGELWSVAIMLRLALIENLRRVASRLSWQRAHRDCALAWAQRIDAPSDRHESALIVLADMVREDPPLSNAFVAQFTQALQGRGATTTFVLAWLEQRLAERGQTIEEVVRAESQSQAADQASMANSIASLRLVQATEWHGFVEANSRTEEILRSEPARVYGQMDFATRDEYRRVVEVTARRLRVDEELVAATAVRLASARYAADRSAAAGHVGYLLVDEGRPDLERALRGKPATATRSRRWAQGLKLLGYLAPVALLAGAAAGWLAWRSESVGGALWASAIVCAALAASQCAVATVSWGSSLLRRPRALPRLDFERGIPDSSRTIAVVPTMLAGQPRIAGILEGLELRYLANRDPNLWFGLLTDFADAEREHLDGDEDLLAQAAAGIEELNAKYANGTHGRFFLLHRPRLYNPQEGCWMGRERKRGKLEDFNALLCTGDCAPFSRTVGDVSQLSSIRYVITLDTDTDLPWGAGWRLVGAAAHPLNRPRMDPKARRLLRGYAILQPRVGISLTSAGRTRYSRLLAGEVGADPYTRLVSDLYQDLFAEASFIGKGIYDVGAFRELLDGRFPENAVLSHDLLESCYARAGQCSDVELLEESPSGYLADVSRRHRWMRGDWQIAPWLGLRVWDAAGERRHPSIAALGWWKIFDNVRRALVAPAYAVLFVLGWTALSTPLSWTLAVLSLLFLPELLPSLTELWRRPSGLPRWLHLITVGQATARRLARTALWLAFLPFEAYVALDAAGRTAWRLLLSRRRLLEWQTAAAVEHEGVAGIGGVFRRMGVGPALAVTLAAWLIATGAPAIYLTAGPILLAWLLSPWLAWWVSRPLLPTTTRLGDAEVRFLRRVARLTWRYFEVFVGPEDGWLPPDNFQDDGDPRIAHRTSPTDMGLALLSNLAAHDLGYLGTGPLLDRTTHAITSMEQLERHRGHFLNWYDTTTRQALRPHYVSTVDSGNLVAHVRVLRCGLLELCRGPLLPPGALAGLRDTWAALSEQTGRSDVVRAVDALLVRPADSLAAQATWLRHLDAAAAPLTESSDPEGHPEAAWWADAFRQQVRSFLADLVELAPWLTIRTAALPVEAKRVLADLDQPATLEELRDLATQGADHLATIGSSPEAAPLLEAVRLGARHLVARLDRLHALAERCAGLTDADMSFLYDPKRKLLAIGYSLSHHRLDNSFYDLLASEARLASYAAIASGQLPFDHWFALGRRLTTAGGRQVLLSWSGSMFEYLMPLLVMPGFDGTLLDQTCHAAVARQIEYGRQRGTPWGISESCYAVTDVEGTYQYRAFGVPGLGLQRGLSDDVVVAPYASALALLIDPRRACANLRRMAEDGYLGPYGFFEAIDFTPARARAGSRRSVVKAYMSHHHGMSLLALGRTVLGPLMQRRFSSNPDLRAASLLLQERIPKTNGVMHPHEREARVVHRAESHSQEHVMRVHTDPSGPSPEVHLLSNGRYHVMVSAAGAGYSRWGDLAVTRWREDPTREAYGVFCFIGEKTTRRCWSSTFQPTLQAGRDYEAVFTSGRAEFRRRDDEIETHTEIAVSAEDDLEIRRVRLTNRSDSPRALLFTGYTELVLAPGVTDERHRAFSNLFVTTELLVEHSAVLTTRRPRSTEERPPWAFCLLLAPAGQSGACSYDTDRERCLGRGRTAAHPAMVEDWSPLPGTSGAVLDPCVALRRTVDLESGGSATLDLILGAAPTREAALALISKYQDHRMADRVLEGAAAQSEAALGELGSTEAEAQRYGQLACALVFPVGAYRAPSSVLRRNRRGQAGLWAYGISGDLPIVLLRLGAAANLQLLRDLLKAHAYWRRRGLSSDLVIWNEDATGYRQAVRDEILGLIAAGPEAQLLDKPGGVFLRHVDGFPEADRVLLQTAARIVLRDTDGSLAQQIERRRRLQLPTEAPSSALVARQGSTSVGDAAPSRRDDLIFANGIGGFTRDGREYIVDLAAGRHTPAPWVNVIANARIGTVVSESGAAYTWFENAQLLRLTPWDNDAVTDASGERLFVRDDASGQSFSPMPGTHGAVGAYTCRHGFGYSIFEHAEDGLETVLTTYVAVSAAVKFWVLKVTNRTDRRRSVSVLASMDLVLGDLRSRHAMHVITELEPLTGAILARNSFESDPGGTVAFFDCSEAQRSVSGDRAEVLGRNGDPASPAALRRARLSGRLGPGLDPCAAMQTKLELGAGAEREVVFVLGAAKGTAEAVGLIQSHVGVAVARVALKEVWELWNDKLGVLYAETPDAALDVLMNGWLPYQVLSCRMWGRSGFYQSGGAYGFRDQLQDCLALLHEAPELCRQHLLRCAGRQFVEGDVQHWWHPPGGRGVRTSCSDDYLWLPYAVARYVSFTGDTGVLDERVPYLTGRPLGEGEESYYDAPGRSDQAGSLYEHCTRALLHGRRLGEHGLPLMGNGDWNDGMNRVGHLGRGESVWLGFFLHEVLALFAPLARTRGDQTLADECHAFAASLARHIEEHGWDGAWYRRAYFDDGAPLGSSQNAECRIDSLPQSWATIAAVGDPERRELALDSLWEQLVSEDLGIVRLFTPPFDRSDLDPGYIKGYPPGVRENGGQYTHGAVWAAMALALAGRSEQAAALVSLLNPIHHAADPSAVERYRVEPYVLAADVYGQAPHDGRGGWTWYTGSAGWFYRMLHEVVFGIERRVDTLRFRPRVPASWARFKLHYRYYQTFYHLVFVQDPGLRGPIQLTVDGEPAPSGILQLANDLRDHTVEIVFGAAARQGDSRAADLLPREIVAARDDCPG